MRERGNDIIETVVSPSTGIPECGRFSWKGADKEKRAETVSSYLRQTIKMACACSMPN